MQNWKKAGAAILRAAEILSKQIDDQTLLLQKFEKRIETNMEGIKESKEEITLLKKKVEELEKENSTSKKVCDKHSHYKRQWNLELIGLLEKDGEDSREVIIGSYTYASGQWTS